MITATEAKQYTAAGMSAATASLEYTKARVELAIREAAYDGVNITNLSVPEATAADIDLALKEAGYTFHWVTKGKPYRLIHISW